MNTGQQDIIEAVGGALQANDLEVSKITAAYILSALLQVSPQQIVKNLYKQPSKKQTPVSVITNKRYKTRVVVTGLQSYGVFCSTLDTNERGLLHVSVIAPEFIEDPCEYYNIGDEFDTFAVPSADGRLRFSNI